MSKRICQLPGCNQPIKARDAHVKTCSPKCGYELRKLLGAGKGKCEPAANATEQHDQKLNSWQISLDKTRICTLEQLIEHCKVDLRTWEVERFVANKWEVGARGDAGLVVEPLFQVKAWLRRKVNTAAALDEIALLRDEAKKHAPVFRAVKRPDVTTGNVLELAVFDTHFGKLAWGRETAHGDYDLGMACTAYEDAINNLMARASGTKLDKIVLVIGNDLFHTDTRNNTTTKGTQVDSDSRYHKVFQTVRRLIIRKIEELRVVAPVRVVVVPGNHDEITAWHLGDSIECWFARCTDVTVDNEPTARKYLQHGSVMLMWTHGDKGKHADYPLLMATERPEMWGRTKWREIHCGHLHTTRTQEFHGVRVRIIPSLSGTDWWHSSNGFTGNMRSSEGHIWNATEGLIGTVFYSIPDQAAA